MVEGEPIHPSCPFDIHTHSVARADLPPALPPPPYIEKCFLKKWIVGLHLPTEECNVFPLFH